MKQCKRCNEAKPLTEYYKHSQMADGHLNICKCCKRQDAVNVRNARIEYYRNYDRSRANNPERVQARLDFVKSEAGKVCKKAAIKRYIEKNPQKRAAHIAVGNALKKGLLVKQGCEVCSASRAEAHHDDYAEQLAVRWLCPKHHADWHKKNEPLFNGKPIRSES